MSAAKRLAERFAGSRRGGPLHIEGGPAGRRHPRPHNPDDLVLFWYDDAPGMGGFAATRDRARPVARLRQKRGTR